MARILVIEDEPLLRKRIASILTEQGHDVEQAENGQQGIDRLQENGMPSLIILDMVMPTLNGWGFLDFQRNRAIYAEIPVVIISAYEGMALSAKPQAYLSKPVDSKELLEKVALFLG